MLSRLGYATVRHHQPIYGYSVRNVVKATTIVNDKPFDPKAVVTQITPYSVPQPVPWNGPERDLKNYPGPQRLEELSPCRHFFFPESWFKFFYAKTGVTGPYCLTIGLWVTLVSKELWIIQNESEWQHFLAIMGWMYIISYSGLGKKVMELIDKSCDNETENEKDLAEMPKLHAEAVESCIVHEKKEQWRQEGKSLLFQAKKDNVGLQLEAAYRDATMDLYTKVKRCLDYQVEVTNIDSRVKQRYMVQWVINKVKESVTPEQEKQSLQKCIADLNLLVAKV